MPIRLEEGNPFLIQQCLWSRRWFEKRIVEQIDGVRAVIVGHHALEKRTTLGNVICIDTGGNYGDGHSTVLDAATLRPARMTALATSRDGE